MHWGGVTLPKASLDIDHLDVTSPLEDRLIVERTWEYRGSFWQGRVGSVSLRAVILMAASNQTDDPNPGIHATKIPPLAEYAAWEQARVEEEVRTWNARMAASPLAQNHHPSMAMNCSGFEVVAINGGKWLRFWMNQGDPKGGLHYRKPLTSKAILSFDIHFFDHGSRSMQWRVQAERLVEQIIHSIKLESLEAGK